MKIKLIGSTNRLKAIKSMKRFSYDCGRTCYTEKDFEEVQKEIPDKKLMQNMIGAGHHSIFEHLGLNFNMEYWPKMFVMLLNNEKQYATSEKSARYTEMTGMVPEQKEKYDKWTNLLIPEIESVLPQINNPKKRDDKIKKLAQENARYMTSVFTPTKMIHSLNFRQINFLIGEFKEFYDKYKKSDDVFKQRLTKSMREFINQTERFKVKDLENQTDRHLSIFNPRSVEEHFGDVYSTSYPMSFAGLAQAHRHRTINYHISEKTKPNAKLGFFIPEIVLEKKLYSEWIKDLNEVAKEDFPQAQLVKVNERGIIEDFRSKAILRMCGHAQHEIMKNTFETAKKYEQYQLEFKGGLNPKCEQGYKCKEPCIWTGKKALERIV